jgi:hypothetical protein
MHLLVFLTYTAYAELPYSYARLHIVRGTLRSNLELPQIHTGDLPKSHRFRRQRIHGGVLPLLLGISPRGFEIVAHRSTDRIDKIRMIYALGEHANAFCRQAPQKCASTFVDGRNIENEMHCLTVVNGLLATRLQHINACRRDFPGNCQTRSLFAEFFIYSKHKPTSALRFPLVIRSTFLDSACRICRNRRHPTWQEPNAGLVGQGGARIDIAGDPTGSEQLEKIVRASVLNVASM